MNRFDCDNEVSKIRKEKKDTNNNEWRVGSSTYSAWNMQDTSKNKVNGNMVQNGTTKTCEEKEKDFSAKTECAQQKKVNYENRFAQNDIYSNAEQCESKPKYTLKVEEKEKVAYKCAIKKETEELNIAETQFRVIEQECLPQEETVPQAEETVPQEEEAVPQDEEAVPQEEETVPQEEETPQCIEVCQSNCAQDESGVEAEIEVENTLQNLITSRTDNMSLDHDVLNVDNSSGYEGEVIQL